VLFVVDFSGSMGLHREDQGGQVEAGNDPRSGQSCGRLDAARAVANQLTTQAQSGAATVQVGMLAFAGDVLGRRTVAPVPLASFAGLLTADRFCSYVTQNNGFAYGPTNPGGLLAQDEGADASTNYAAALTAAGQLLSSVQGAKVVYFISDGEPTAGGSDPVQAAVQAGAALVAGVPGVTLDALLLGDGDPQAATVMRAVVGGRGEQVRVAARADELAQEILRFPSVELDPSTAQAVLSGPSGNETVPLKSAGRDQATGRWVYETQAFSFGAQPGDDVRQLRVSAASTGGVRAVAAAELRIQRL